jgi:hypothetical protein
MRRTSFITVLLLSFSIFTFIGFRIAVQTGRSAALAPHPAGDSQNSRTILVHVDSLESEQPVLQSVWVAVLFQSKDQTVLSFVPLFPAPPGQPSTASLAQSFSMTSQGEPSAAFWRRLKSHQIDWDDFILVDDAGLANSSTWLGPMDGTNIPVTGLISALPASEVLDLGCRMIQTAPKTGLRPNSPTPDTNEPGSPQTLEGLFARWKDIAASQHPVKCEVVVD